ncbi:MAG: DUF4012 domain-containing protein, partial [Candidatus Shapirobacteria bacterium]|nr:DUF4012 domain-containing protein [Candidatus Shapirobacteria bacterium]
MDQIITKPQKIITETPMTEKKIDSKKTIKRKTLSILSIVLIAISIVAVILFFLVFVPGRKILAQIENIKKSIPVIQQAVSDKDLDKIKETLITINNQTKSLENSYKKLAYTKNLPIIGKYYKDGQQILIIAKEGIDTADILVKAIEPYKDFLGVKGSSTSNEKTTEDRISFLTESIEGLIPYLDQIEKKIIIMQTAIDQIDPNRYPEEFKGYKIKSNIIKAQESITEVHKLVKNGQPIFSKISWLLGKDSPRKYLMIFQNDGELRPSGGFWTAYSTIIVKNGKVTPGTASNIYDLDDKIA